MKSLPPCRMIGSENARSYAQSRGSPSTQPTDTIPAFFCCPACSRSPPALSCASPLLRRLRLFPARIASLRSPGRVSSYVALIRHSIVKSAARGTKLPQLQRPRGLMRLREAPRGADLDLNLRMESSKTCGGKRRNGAKLCTGHWTITMARASSWQRHSGEHNTVITAMHNIVM